MLSATACTSFAGNCTSPMLVTTFGDPAAHDGGVHLWRPFGHHETLATDPAAGATLSPEGSAVAYVLPSGQYDDTNGPGHLQSRVAVLSLATRQVRPLSADIPRSTVSDLQWSADGTEIAFVRRDAGSRQIDAVRVADGAERKLIELNDRQSGTFAWSADGRELLVPTSPSSFPPIGSPQPTSELWRYFIDTGYHAVIQTPHQWIGGLAGIAWSPDGRFVAMGATIPDTTRDRLFVLDLDTGVSSPIDRRRGNPESLTWSGRYLFYLYYVWTPDDARYLMRWDSRSGKRVRVQRPGQNEVLGGYGTISAPSCG
jgi:Tol biopolymer transport system component